MFIIEVVTFEFIGDRVFVRAGLAEAAIQVSTLWILHITRNST